MKCVEAYKNTINGQHSALAALNRGLRVWAQIDAAVMTEVKIIATTLCVVDIHGKRFEMHEVISFSVYR